VNFVFWYQFNKKGGVCRVEDRTKYIARTERQEPDKTANRKKIASKGKPNTGHNTCRRKTTQDEEKQDRNGQNKRGGGS